MEQGKLTARYTRAMLFYVIAFAVSITILSVVLTELINAFSVPVAEEGLMSSMISIGALAALICMALLSGRVKTATVLDISGLLMVALIACTGLMPTYPAILVCFFLFGLTVGFIDACANAFIVELNGAQSGKYLGALHGCSGGGCIIAPLLIQWLLSLCDWRNIYLILAVVVAVPIITFVVTGRQVRGRLPEDASSKYRLTRADFRDYITDRQNILLLLCLFLYTCSMNGVNLWTVRYVSVTLATPALGSLCLSCYWLCSTASRFLVPAMRRPSVQKFIIGAFAGFVTMTLGVLSRNPILMCVCWGLTGIVSGHSVPTLIDMGTARYTQRPGLPSSVLVIMMYLATSIFPMIMSAVNAVFTMYVSMVLPGVMLAVSGLLALRLRQAGNL